MNSLLFFVLRPRGCVLLALGIVLAGLVAWWHMPVATLPAVDLPTMGVAALLPGASPQTMASAVATPLERRIGAISGVTEITSVTVLGATQITIQFDPSRRMDAAAADVQAALDEAAPLLPKDLPQPPIAAGTNPVAAPILFLAVTSDTLPLAALFDWTQRVIVPRIAGIAGVGRAMVAGGDRAAIRIRTDPETLAAMGLGLEDVRAALVAATRNAPKGTLESATASWSVAANDQMFDADAYRDLVVAVRGGAPVRLGQVATVSEGVANTRAAAWLNGQRAVFVFVQRAPAANTVETVRRVRAALPQLAQWLPGSIQVHLVADRSDDVIPLVREAEITVIASFLVITVVVIFALRSPRAALIASVSIPVSLCGTLAVMRLFGFGLDMMSLAGIAIAVGLVIDDAVVVVENIVRWRASRPDAGALRAALAGTRQIAPTILAMSLVLLAILGPLLLAPGVIGLLMDEFAGALCIAIVLSAALTLTLTPALCAVLLPHPLALPVPGRLRRGYAASLGWALRHPLAMVGATAALCGATIWLAAAAPKGFLPAQDTGLMIGMISARPDIAFPAMVQRQEAAAHVIMDDPAVDSVATYVGAQDATGNSFARLYVALKPQETGRDPPEAVIARLRPRLAELPGAATFLRPVEDLQVGARDSTGAYQFSLHDADADELARWLPRIVQALAALPALTDIDTDQLAGGLQARLEIDRDAASRMGVTTAAIDETLYDAFGQRHVAVLTTGRDHAYVVLEATGLDLDTIGRLFVPGAGGTQVALRTVTRLTDTLVPLRVTHQGQLPTATVSFNLAPGIALDAALRLVKRTVAALHPPAGLESSFEGNAGAFQALSFGEPALFLAAVLVVYAILGILYESFRHPLTILSTLPSTALGALLALALSGMEITAVAFIGIMLVLGIVTKNAILLVDFAQARRRAGRDARGAILDACAERVRPIVMTSVTAFLSAVPLALSTGLGADFRRPLGVAILGGLIVSQLVTLYTVPSIYLLLDRLSVLPASLWRRRRRHRRSPA